MREEKGGSGDTHNENMETQEIIDKAKASEAIGLHTGSGLDYELDPDPTCRKYYQV